MAEFPDWLRIPDEFAESGDPVEENPFPSSDARHAVWMDATRAAEQEWARVNAYWMAALSPENWMEWPANSTAARFSVWAKRGIHVVWSERELRQYDLWLVQYANATLEALADLFSRKPPPFGRESILLDVRNRLGEQIQYWKAEARRCRAEQQTREASRNDVTSPRVTAGVVKRRKRLISDYRAKHDLNAADFARRSGISESAIRGIVREDRERFAPETRQRLLEILGLTLHQWQQED